MFGHVESARQAETVWEVASTILVRKLEASWVFPNLNIVWFVNSMNDAINKGFVLRRHSFAFWLFIHLDQVTLLSGCSKTELSARKMVNDRCLSSAIIRTWRSITTTTEYMGVVFWYPFWSWFRGQLKGQRWFKFLLETTSEY